MEVNEDGNPVKTGDMSNVMPFILVCIAALVAIVYFARNRQKESADE